VALFPAGLKETASPKPPVWRCRPHYLNAMVIGESGLSPQVKRLGRKDDDYLTSKLRINEARTPLPHMPSWRAQGRLYLLIRLVHFLTYIRSSHVSGVGSVDVFKKHRVCTLLLRQQANSDVTEAVPVSIQTPSQTN
jgi:hypothetical protein